MFTCGRCPEPGSNRYRYCSGGRGGIRTRVSSGIMTEIYNNNQGVNDAALFGNIPSCSDL